MIHSTNGFLKTIPRTPIYRHIGQVHYILLHLYGSAGSPGEQFMEAAERSLREIAVASMSMLSPEERYAEQMRRHRVDHPPANLAPSMAEAVRNAFKNMSEVVSRLRRPPAPLTPEGREAVAQRKYERMLRAQRTEARVHLSREVARVRRELGLNETGEGQ